MNNSFKQQIRCPRLDMSSWVKSFPCVFSREIIKLTIIHTPKKPSSGSEGVGRQIVDKWIWNSSTFSEWVGLRFQPSMFTVEETIASGGTPSSHGPLGPKKKISSPNKVHESYQNLMIYSLPTLLFNRSETEWRRDWTAR